MSPPSRGRGSKPHQQRITRAAQVVAPFTGAWIETFLIPAQFGRTTVAPFTGAWIETGLGCRHGRGAQVAPFTGAWIETGRCPAGYSSRLGRPLHGGVDRNTATRGTVKLIGGRPLHGGVDRNRQSGALRIGCPDVAPFTGAWIETPTSGRGAILGKSPPSRGRGSKHKQIRKDSVMNRSPPSRGRGSKPFFGAEHSQACGRPLHGGVDRNIRFQGPIANVHSRPLHGGVDRNLQANGH